MIPFSNTHIHSSGNRYPHPQFGMQSQVQAFQQAEQRSSDAESLHPLLQAMDILTLSTEKRIDDSKSDEQAYKELREIINGQADAYAYWVYRDQQLPEAHQQRMAVAKKYLPEEEFGKSIKAIETAYQQAQVRRALQEVQQKQNKAHYTVIDKNYATIHQQVDKAQASGKQQELAGVYNTLPLSRALQSQAHDAQRMFSLYSQGIEVQERVLSAHNALNQQIKLYSERPNATLVKAMTHQALSNLQDAFRAQDAVYTNLASYQKGLLKSQTNITDAQKTLLMGLYQLNGKYHKEPEGRGGGSRSASPRFGLDRTA